MTRSELSRELAKRRGLTQKTASSVVDAMLAGFVSGLCAGRRIEVRGFGTFRARHYPQYRGRNPRTGAGVEVPHKVLPVFRPGKALLRLVNQDDSGVFGSAQE